MKSTLLASTRYKKFTQDRNLILEKIHRNAETDISRMLYEKLDQIEATVSQMALRPNISASHDLENRLLLIFSQLLTDMENRVGKMRKSVFILSYLGELEAIGQSTQRGLRQTPDLKAKQAKAEKSKTIRGEDLSKRMWIVLMRLRSKIVDRFRIAVVQEMPPHEIVNYVTQAFPRIQVFKRLPRELKPLREASHATQEKQDFFKEDFIDEGDWDLVVQAYKDTELPPSRFDDAAQYDPESGYARYNWEIEQELSNDFVNQVRAGEVDAANDLGIQEFVWVAILDDKTDDCCVQRNGKTTQEIEDGLADGSIDGDLCDAITAPAHMNCRCQMAPVASTDEVQGPDWNSFGEWLNS